MQGGKTMTGLGRVGAQAPALDALPVGSQAVVASVESTETSLRAHLFDMGLTPGTTVSMMKVAPLGDPIEIRLRGYELTLRKDDAARIALRDVRACSGACADPSCEGPVPGRAAGTSRPEGAQAPHPALGEGRYSPRRDAAAGVTRPDAPLSVALVGNQNCGKTTLFNQLTGSNQHVGNFPGVTVDRKDGPVRKHPHVTLTDLPGIYSLSPYTGEEVVTREFILRERPDAVIDVLDATNIERNLYLTLQLMELDVPLVIALNMMDEVTANGGTVDVNALEALLGVPVVPISASRGEGIDELVEHVLNVARRRERPGRLDFCRPDGPDGGALHRCIHGIAELVGDHAERARIPVRFAATKLVEGDALVRESLGLDANELAAVEHIVVQMEREASSDRLAAIADMRFTFIEAVCERTVKRPRESREHRRSVAVDRVLTGRFTALPVFALIMALVFWVTFGLVGQPLADLLDAGITSLIGLADEGLRALAINDVVRSLIVDGALGGIGSVLGFLPVIATLFLMLSILEDSGYMARVAFVMDRALRRIGLSGRSLVPMLIGFGCSVPAIMATRTLPSEHDRRLTVLLTPFMSCSAKLPVYAMISSALFPQAAALVMFSLYFLGMAVGVCVALVLRRTAFRGEPVPFIMELPNYRLPSLRSTLLLVWEKAKGFVTKAFTIIFVASVVVWFLQTFDVRLNVVADQGDSLLAALGGLIAPVFAPLGFGDWRAACVLATGFLAKESVVSTLTVLTSGLAVGMGAEAGIAALFTPLSAYSFLVFTLLYTPCVAAIGVVRGELGGRYALGMVALQCGVAWLVAFVVHVVGGLLLAL